MFGAMPGSRARGGRFVIPRAPFTLPIVGTVVQVNFAQFVDRFSQVGNAQVTLVANSTLGAPINVTPGSNGLFKFKMDATGSRTLTGLTSNGWICDGDTAFTIGTTASKSSLVSWMALDATHILLSLLAVNISAG